MARNAAGQGWEHKVTDLPGVGEPELAIDAVHGALVVSFNGCGIAVSSNQGTTWDVRAAHPSDPGPTPGVPFHNCSDPVAAAGPDGALYVGAGYWDTPDVQSTHYNIYVARSDDGGVAWGKPVFATGDRDIGRVLHLGRNTGHSDRAFITVDGTSGTVYVSASDFPRLQRWIVASHDRAQTFGPPKAIDSVLYPQATGQLGGDDIPAAANGQIAIAYVAGAAPGNDCPCNIFETSSDDGETWVRHFTPLAANWTAADPHAPGHYAIMSAQGATATAANVGYVSVSTTTDSGATWTTPVLIGQKPSHPRIEPWIAYSPKGVLAVGYKTLYADPQPQPAYLALALGGEPGAYDYWAAVSFDNGQTFSRPLRVSNAVSPRGNSAGTDDFSSVAVDDRYLYASWGDSRTDPMNPAPGPLSIYFARVPLTAFNTASDQSNTRQQ